MDKIRIMVLKGTGDKEDSDEERTKMIERLLADKEIKLKIEIPQQALGKILEGIGRNFVSSDEFIFNTNVIVSRYEDDSSKTKSVKAQFWFLLTT